MQKGETIGLAPGPVVRASTQEDPAGWLENEGVTQSLRDIFGQFQDSLVSYCQHLNSTVCLRSYDSTDSLPVLTFL